MLLDSISTQKNALSGRKLTRRPFLSAPRKIKKPSYRRIGAQKLQKTSKHIILDIICRKNVNFQTFKKCSLRAETHAAAHFVTPPKSQKPLLPTVRRDFKKSVCVCCQPDSPGITHCSVGGDPTPTQHTHTHTRNCHPMRWECSGK